VTFLSLDSILLCIGRALRIVQWPAFLLPAVQGRQNSSSPPIWCQQLVSVMAACCARHSSRITLIVLHVSLLASACAWSISSTSSCWVPMHGRSWFTQGLFTLNSKPAVHKHIIVHAPAVVTVQLCPGNHFPVLPICLHCGILHVWPAVFMSVLAEVVRLRLQQVFNTLMV
jgi:hypothetical protein